MSHRKLPAIVVLMAVLAGLLWRSFVAPSRDGDDASGAAIRGHRHSGQYRHQQHYRIDQRWPTEFTTSMPCHQRLTVSRPT